MSGVASLVAELRAARVLDLEQPRYAGAPTFAAHAPGFQYVLHRRHEPGLGEARTSASGLITTAEHSGTHIDALCHQAENLGMHGGCMVTPQVQTPAGFTELSAESIPPVLARGILLDVAGQAGVDRLPDGYAVSGDDLQAASDAAGVEVGEGDVVLVRTGNATAWEDPETYLRGPGLGAGAGRWLAERRPLAVGTDNVALDVVGDVDPELGTLPCHVLLLVRGGIYIIENLQLEELARSGVTEFAFVCLALKMRGVTGSPVRPLALIPASRRGATIHA